MKGSKFNSETMTTVRRLGKGMQKTANISASKKYGGTRGTGQEPREANAYKLYNGRLPIPLRNKETQHQEQETVAAEKKTEEKEEAKEQQLVSQNPNDLQHSFIKGDNSDLGQSEMDQSDDEHKKKDEEKNSKLQQELKQIIYISIVETDTTILYYSPSTKYLTIKNDKFKEEQEFLKDEYKKYTQKLKNKETFAKKAAQTINRFKSNQIVSTSMLKDADTQMVDEKINCLNYIISDAILDKRTKNDDVWLQNQKMLDKKVNKALKKTLRVSTEMLTVDSSIRSEHKSEMNESSSLADTILSSNLQSSRRPKVQRSNMGASQDKGILLSEKKSSPNSSFIKNSLNSEHQTTKGDKGIFVNMQIKRALNEELPKTLANPLKYVERLLSQNQFHWMQIAYKDYPVNMSEFDAKPKAKEKALPIPALGGMDGEKENAQEAMNYHKDLELIKIDTDEPVIRKLLTYSIDGLLKSKNIDKKYICHAMDWNKNNEDLLAAVYGDPDINSKDPGFLCFWTLKNPLHPERVIETPRGLTYCNFSKRNPYLIVVSDYMGEIMIYDLRTNSDKPIADSSEVKDKHTDIVWECKWIERPNDKNEIIVTTSSDGKMKEWSLKKGLEVTDLLKMKKTTSFPMKHLNPFAKYLRKDRSDPNNKEGKEIKDTLIFREANGLSFDFPKNDTTVYYVALEECTIHRCRISYKDQYTDNYYGHQGPVYKIRCNPFDPNILISCSYDWTVKIWNNKHNYPVMNLHTNELNHQVNDIEWSGDTSTIFGDVADDGRIEIWDLARRAIQPIIIYDKDTGVPKKSIKFSIGGKVVATGSADGKIDVFRLYNLEHSPVSEQHQRDHLKNVIDQNSDINTKI